MSSLFSRRQQFASAALMTFFVGHSLFGFTKTGTNYTTDGSQPDVMAALANANPGDTVHLPAGTFTWGTGFVAVNLNNAVNLIGAGETQTIINLDSTGPNGVYGAIQIFAPAIVGYFKINGSASNDVNPFAIGATSGWRITHITYDGNGGGGHDAGYFAFVAGSNGLIDSCTINGGAGNAELIFTRGPTDAWQTADTPGTVNAVYVEDCTFGGSGYVSDFNSNSRAVVRYCTITANMKIDAHGFDSNGPPRSFREIEAYGNTWTNGGAEAFDIRGGTGFLFDNKVTNTDPTSAWFILESYGIESYWQNYGVIISSATATLPCTITTVTPHGYQSGWGPVQVVVSNPAGPTFAAIIASTYTVTVTGPNTFTIPFNPGVAGVYGYTTTEQTPFNYPLPDQIGVGQDPKVAHSDPMYLWNNTAAGGVDWALTWKNPDVDAIALYKTQTGNPAATFTMQDIVAADRDYFKHMVGGTFNGSSGVGRGTKAQMNAITPTKTGVGFWVTDEASWNFLQPANASGQFYVWNGTAWVLKYTPFTYPHPLRRPVGPSALQIGP